MERGSSSRLPRSGYSEEADSEDASPRLPPLAAAAHAAQVLRSSSLNPNADPFSASPGGRIQFSDSEESLEVSDSSPPPGRGKAPAGPSRRRRSRRRWAQPSGFMAAARRQGPRRQDTRHPGAVERRLRSVVVHPARLASVPDVDGFRLVESRRRWRRRDPAPKSRPVPDNLVGLCFNCLGTDHVHAKCTFPSRCFSCLQEGHHARDCPRSRGAAKRGRSPTRTRGGSHATRRRRDSPGRGPANVAAPSRVVRAANASPSARAGAVLVHGAGAAASDAAPSRGVAAGAAPSSPAGNGVADASASSAGVAEERPVFVPPPLRLQRRPASPSSRASEPLTELVVVPRTAPLQAAEDELSSLALVAMVVGRRPPVSPAMVRAHLLEFYGLGADQVSVRRFWPDDFIVRFYRREDLDVVLGTPPPVVGAFSLRWRPWSRLFMASAGAFRFRVLVGMKGIPCHARSLEVAQLILASACAEVQLAGEVHVADPDDDREIFAAAWCVHPDLIPDEKILAIPERAEEHDGGPPLFLRPEELIHAEVPALRYLVRLRVVEYQDWHSPPPSDDEDYRRRDDSGEDSDDSNFNGFWPGYRASGGAGPRPRTSRFGGTQDPRLQRSFTQPFQQRGPSQVVTVGQVCCPITSIGLGAACGVNRAPALQPTPIRVVTPIAVEVDLGLRDVCPLSPVKSLEEDPMRAEATLCLTPKAALEVHAPRPPTLDRDPRAYGGTCARPFDGLVKVLDGEFSSAVGRFGLHKDAVDDGPCFLFNPSRPAPEPADVSWAMDELMDQQSPGGLLAASSLEHDIIDGARMDAPVAVNLSAEEFVATFTKPLEDPLLPTPSLRRTKPSRQDDEDWMPKRSARLAAKSRSRDARPDAQARKLLMKKLGYEVDTLRPHEASFDEFHDVAFQAALCGQAGEAMQCLFKGKQQRVLRCATEA